MTDTPRPSGGAIDHEIDRRGILQAGIWLAVVTAAGFVVAWLVYLGLANAAGKADPAPSPLAAARVESLPPGPQLQARPELELAALREQAQERLEGWGWVDREANLAHIPIERAIELVAAEAAAQAATPEPASDEAAGSE